jgi:hypothetical protein
MLCKKGAPGAVRRGAKKSLGEKQGVLHCMEAADEKLAWRMVSDHCQ